MERTPTRRPRRVLCGLMLLIAAVAALAAACQSDGAGAGPPPAASETPGPATTAPPGRTATPPPAARPPAAGDAAVLTGTITRIVDGDTVHVHARGFDTVVRLIGIDTPETRHPTRPVECWGPEATARTKALLPPGTAVRLQSDPTQDTRDRYGRLLAHIYTGTRSGAASVNRALVAAGAARVHVYGGVPFRHAAAFTRAEAAARAAGRGLWGPPCRGRTTTGASAPAPPPAPPADPGARCDENYRGACVPPHPPDVDCADIGRPVTVVGADPHHLDGDGNGRGCERYAR